MASFRTGIDEDKMKALYEKHGLKYVPRRRPDASGPSAKVRRVEKPIRIRVHWTCHECNGHLARDRICMACGHRRCDECIRSPAKMAGVDNSGGDDDDDDDDDDKSGGKIIKTYRYTMHVRPKYGEYLVLRPKTQIIRRQCHRCDHPFLPASRQECENCQHIRCSLCPRWPAKLDKWPHGSPGDEKPSPEDVLLVPVVQRVYKKPRQRVRYTCDQCEAVLLDRQTCRNCGHTKCENCSRYP
ncbi:hypothetical protein M433DRAFT_61014 [Acidomyces richmondensis BFW]|nr:MAG: hypothetical protein FE78DRAFT_136924 [Acidomyces sp. 'richmondensis']KYG48509.1 hypothetical protein M433DRAFT_61014 [Acidomyces richmondensis BFW]